MARCRPTTLRCLGPNVYTEAPDGGWGWIVAVSFFLVEVFTYGTIKSFGIFFNDIMEEYGESNSRVSWIVSICVFVMAFNAPLSSVMTTRFGFQMVVMLGGLLISVGTIATSFTASVNQMYITYGLVAGLGYCLTFLPTVTLLSHYFTQRRSLVTALASTGESLSMFALAPAFSALRNQIGWRRTLAVVGALQSTIVVCGVVLRPIVVRPKAADGGDSSRELEILSSEKVDSVDGAEKKTDFPKANGSVIHSEEPTLREGVSKSPEENVLLQDSVLMANEKKSEVDQVLETERSCDVERRVEEKKRSYKLLDFSILKETSFILYSLFGLFATLGFFAPHLYIIQLSVSRGVERDQATYMLSIMAVAEILGRFSIGWILSRRKLQKKKLLVVLACVIIMMADLVGFTLVTEFYGLAVCCALYGFFMGTLACTHIPLLAEDDVVGIERMSSAAGVYVFIQSFAGLAGPPLGGWLVDLTDNYGSAFYSCAAGMAVSAVFLGLVGPAKKGLLCKKKAQNTHAVQETDTQTPNEDSTVNHLRSEVDPDQVETKKGEPGSVC